ncbi:outer membrane efflux protein [mine drainage metagenome]|uniref:Outer membrane efflux protein n=1 Tax=mine drainage metagenome TaxID=410659 RepID=A0A1J5S4P3_9ZZZZ
MGSFYKRKYSLILSISLLLSSLSVYAQNKIYTLSELTESAKNYLPSLMQKKALVNSAKAFVTDTRHSFLPQLKVSDQINIASDNSLEGSYLPLGITPSTSGGIRNSNNGQAATGNIAVLYSEYELMNFGLNKAKINNAQSYVNFSEADLQKENYYVTLQVAQLYFDLLKTQYRLDADLQNVNRYDSIFKVIQALTLSGLKAGSDSSLAKAELSKTKITYNQTLGNLEQLKEQLSYLTGIPAAKINIDSLSNKFIVNRPSIFNYSIDTVNNPLIDYYAKKKDIFLSNDRLISKLYLPKIILAGSTWARGSSIQYNDNYESLSNGLGYQRFNYAAGIAITYNLFNNLYKKDKLAINRYQLQASDLELQQQKILLNSSLLQADNSLKTTEANLLELPVQLKSAEDTYQQKLAQYKAGIISLIDLTNASFVLYRSQTDYIETMTDWYVAQLNKSAAAGNLNQFIQTIK